MKGYLLVRAAGVPYGFRLDQVREVIDGLDVYAAPGVHPAVRGVTPVRNRLVPLVHLVALLMDEAPPNELGHTAVLTECGEAMLAFEVDDAEAVVRDEPLPVPGGWSLPWASGVARIEEVLVPVVNVEVLVDRLALVGAEEER